MRSILQFAALVSRAALLVAPLTSGHVGVAGQAYTNLGKERGRASL